MTNPSPQPNPGPTDTTTDSRPAVDSLAVATLPAIDSQAIDAKQAVKLAKQADRLELKEQVKDQLAGLLATIDDTDTGNSLEKVMKGLVDGVLTDSTPRARDKVSTILCMALKGETWGKALDAGGLPWAALSSMRQHNRSFGALMAACDSIADEACKRRRLKLADSRAFDGIDMPTKDGGTYKVYSDRLAELLIKGDDPARYSPQTSGSQQSSGSAGPLAIQINVNLPCAVIDHKTVNV